MSGELFTQIAEGVSAARTELILFCIAFLAHSLLFGNLLPRKKAKGKGKSVDSGGAPQQRPSKLARGGHAADLSLARKASGGSDDEPAPAPGSSESCRALQSCAAAFQRGDHRGVLQCWAALKKHDQVPSTRLAQVVESMQRLKKERLTISEEVLGYLRRNPTLCSIDYMNRLLEPLAQSLDRDLVLSIFDALPLLNLQPNCMTYEVLMQMHFTTRSFQEVSSLAEKMQSCGVVPTRRTSLVLLKAALQLGHLEEALERFREVTANSSGTPTASAAPGHLAVQLVELACREHSLETVLDDLRAVTMPLSTEMVNGMLSECLRAKDKDLADRVVQLASSRGVARSGRTYGLLVRIAGADTASTALLLDEMAETKVDAVSEVAQAVLAVCTQTKSSELADRLCALLNPEQVGQVPAVLALIRFYADAGHPEKACKLYAAYAHDDRRRALVDSRTERCVMAAALQCGRKDLTTGLFDAASGDTGRHISMIRACAAKGNLDEAMKTFQAVEARGAELSPSLWNTALHACVECHDLKRAEALMKRMEEAKVADVVSYNTVIKAHLQLEHYDRAHALMAEMQRVDVTPNHITYNEVINALGRSEREQHRARLWEVVDEMKAQGLRPNRVTCSILLKSLRAKSSQADIMRTLELTDNTEEPMDEVLLSSVMEACVRIGKPGLLAQRLHQLHGQKVVVVTGAHTFGCLIKAYGYAKDIAGAWRCWKEMRSQHVKPTSITIGCMVEAVVTNGDVDGGHELITSLLQDPECREQVNAVVFGSVIKGYGRAHKMECVFSVFEEMLSHNIEPSIATFNAMIDACARSGQMGRVQELLDGMRARNLDANLITYSTMIKGYVQRSDMPAAFSVMEDLRREPGCRPDEVVFNTVLDGCLQAGLMAEAERVFADMQKQGVPPSSYTLTIMVKLLGQAHRLDRAFEIVDAMSQKYRVRANSHVYNALIQACLTARQPLRAVGVFERATRQRQQLDPHACHALVRALLGAGSRARAVGVVRAVFGIGGGREGGPPAERSITGQAADDSLLATCLQGLLSSGDAGLAPPLLRDARAARPKVRVDPALERRVQEVW